MRAILVVTLAAVVVVGTVLSLVRARAWWIRVWDFPRVQLAVVALATLALGWDRWLGRWPWTALGLLVLAALAFQLALVWRYTPLAPREVQRSRTAEAGGRISLVISNVLQTNRQADRLLGVLRAADPDLVLCVETDDWWRDRLDALAATHPHAVRCPLPNTYGMLLYSRLPLEDVRLEQLVEPDIPSVQARVRLPGGARVWLNCVHPRPPAPGESDDSLPRDAELLVVGKRVREAREPVIVCGDLNDVAWSRTTRLFQKVSRLVDPRKGRGLYSTFHARVPLFRWPLDHVFHSDEFRLVALRRLPYVGSDHFPVYLALSHEPPAAAEQEAPAEDAEDLQEARETVAEGKAEAARSTGT
jgi:endonuclease/exonuclease/phosphatase (EEP) superfamily protein YafD